MYAVQQDLARVVSASRFQHAINGFVIYDHWINTEKKESVDATETSTGGSRFLTDT